MVARRIESSDIVALCKRVVGWIPERIERRAGADHNVLVLHSHRDQVVLRYPKSPSSGWVRINLARERWLRQHRIAVPQILHSGESGRYFPLPWLIMEYGGEPLHTADITSAERNRLDEEAGTLLAALHRTAFAESGTVDVTLEQFEPQDHYAMRQRRGERALDWLIHSANIDPPKREALESALNGVLKDNKSVLCHGDFTPDNLLVKDGSVAYVVDWGDKIPIDDPFSDLIRWEMVRRMWGGEFGAPIRGYFAERGDAEFSRYRKQRIPLLVQQVLIRAYDYRNRADEETNRPLRLKLLWSLLTAHL